MKLLFLILFLNFPTFSAPTAHVTRFNYQAEMIPGEFEIEVYCRAFEILKFKNPSCDAKVLIRAETPQAILPDNCGDFKIKLISKTDEKIPEPKLKCENGGLSPKIKVIPR